MYRRDAGRAGLRALKRALLAFVRNMPSPVKHVILAGVDVGITGTSYLITRLITGLGGPGELAGLELMSFGLLLLVAGATSTILGLPYIRLKAYDAKAMALGGVLALLVALFTAALHRIAGTTLSWSATATLGFTMFSLFALSRICLLEMLVAVYRMNPTRRRVMIYGSGTTGIQLARALSTHDTIEPVAFLDDNPALQGLTVAGLPVLRPVDIADLARERGVNRVLLAMPSLSRPKQTQLGRKLTAMGLDVQALPSFAQLIGEEPLLDKLVPIQPARIMQRQLIDRDAGHGQAEYRDRSVLVTGGGGSIGSELCRQILNLRPRRLVILEISEIALYETERSLRPLADEAGIELVAVLGSITEARLIRQILTTHRIEIVLHAAAYKHVNIVEQNPLVGLGNNVMGTWTVAREAQAAGVARFILVSSDKAVRPTNVMGASKRLAELVVQDMASRTGGTVFTMVRFGNVIGSSGSVIPLFKEQIARGGPVTVTDRNVTRYFMAIEEAVSLVLLAGTMATGGEVYVLDMGRPLRIWDLAVSLVHDSDYTVRDADTPDGDIEIVETGLRPGEKLTEELLIGEGFLTTNHEKIFCARETYLSEIEVAGAIHALRVALGQGDADAAVAVAHRWVEGYGAACAAARDRGA